MVHPATTKETSGSGAAAPADAADRTSGNQPDDRSRAVPPMPQSHESRMNRIARRAHEIYEARGGEHGKALSDWLQAEREVDVEIESSRGAED
jgi:hypothetical protein